MSHNRTGMSEPLRILLPLVILALGVGAFMFLRTRGEVPVRPPQQTRAPEVGTAPVAVHNEALTMEVDGQVVPYREINLSAEVTGRVVHKAEVCRAGRFVRQCVLLMRLPPRD